MDEIKPCPCGEIPDKLGIEAGRTPKYAFVYGNCCGEWMVEFKTDYHNINSEECKELARKAWNRAPRGKELYHESIKRIKNVVAKQAEDEGLWSIPLTGLQSIAEAYLQQELRRLHRVIEEEFGET